MQSEPRPDQNANETAFKGLALVLGIALLYSSLHIGFRLLASNVLGEDDVIDNILAQDLRLGYAPFPRQPPLYDWVLWSVQKLTGPGIIGFLLIKYAALIATAGFLYLAAYRALKDRLFAVLTVESLALIYQISWRFHEGFTHEVGAMVAVAATLWLYFRVIETGSIVDFVWLGIATGLGLLTEPPYAVFFVTIILAGLVQPAVRRKLLTPKAMVSLVIALAIAAPYLIWLTSNPSRMSGIGIVFQGPWAHALNGLQDALRGPIAYLSPLLFIVPFIFPGWLKTAWADIRRPRVTGAEPNLDVLVLHAALFATVLSVVGALVFTIRGLAVHVLMPLYVPTVIWLFGVAKRASDSPLPVARFTRLAVAIAAIALAARLLNMFVLDPVCKICRWGIPYAGLGQEMTARGFSKGTIISMDHELAGNLRALFPASKIVTRRYPHFTPQGADWTTGKVAYVWNAKFNDKEVAEYLNKLIPPGLSVGDASVVVVPWHHVWRRTGYRTTTWRLLIVDRDDASAASVQSPADNGSQFGSNSRILSGF